MCFRSFTQSSLNQNVKRQREKESVCVCLCVCVCVCAHLPIYPRTTFHGKLFWPPMSRVSKRKAERMWCITKPVFIVHSSPKTSYRTPLQTKSDHPRHIAQAHANLKLLSYSINPRFDKIITAGCPFSYVRCMKLRIKACSQINS